MHIYFSSKKCGALTLPRNLEETENKKLSGGLQYQIRDLEGHLQS
jgi:hypothetical protein